MIGHRHHPPRAACKIKLAVDQPPDLANRDPTRRNLRARSRSGTDANGVAKFSFESRTIRVGSTANDIVGKGLIVHRDPDDYKTQPTGNAGPRLACAVIAAK